MEQEVYGLFLLTSLESALDNLLESAREKQHLVVLGDSFRIEELLVEEEKLLDDLKRIHNIIKSDHMLCLEISDCPDAVQIQQRIHAKFSEFKMINEQNQKLISKGLEIIKYELSLLMPQNEYSNTLKNSSIVFDRKI